MSRWYISNAINNDGGYIKSKTSVITPQTGWQYTDGTWSTWWYDDNTLRLSGTIYHAVGKYYSFYNITEGEPTYPTTVTVSSTGGAADSQSKSMGVYEKTPRIWSGRPVWQNTARNDRFLFYNGNNSKYV